SQDPAPGTLLSDGVYTVTLCSTDEYGNEGCCTFELTVESILGATDNELNTAIGLYPNPASEQVTLANGSNILLDRAAIYDVNGRLINTIDLTNMGSEMVIDISQLSSGVYIVQISAENSTTVKRLIKE
ncbi:MAG: T9SS type A sorting domain-containing protein, partial [Flavobacteriaceae bacterium]|nr:T9SS type A sorting domain-containing protein [Flavobacteriaceae bacterium]